MVGEGVCVHWCSGVLLFCFLVFMFSPKFAIKKNGTEGYLSRDRRGSVPGCRIISISGKSRTYKIEENAKAQKYASMQAYKKMYLHTHINVIRYR